MKEFIKNNYYLHLIVGGVISRILCETYEGVAIPMQLFLSVFILGVFGFMWEGGWAMKNETVPDWMDVVWGCIGAILGNIIFLVW